MVCVAFSHQWNQQGLSFDHVTLLTLFGERGHSLDLLPKSAWTVLHLSQSLTKIVWVDLAAYFPKSAQNGTGSPESCLLVTSHPPLPSALSLSLKWSVCTEIQRHDTDFRWLNAFQASCFPNKISWAFRASVTNSTPLRPGVAWQLSVLFRQILPSIVSKTDTRAFISVRTAFNHVSALGAGVRGLYTRKMIATTRRGQLHKAQKNSPKKNCSQIYMYPRTWSTRETFRMSWTLCAQCSLCYWKNLIVHGTVWTVRMADEVVCAMKQQTEGENQTRTWHLWRHLKLRKSFSGTFADVRVFHYRWVPVYPKKKYQVKFFWINWFSDLTGTLALQRRWA